MGVFRRGLVYLFKDYSAWTSTHGIPHIGMANAMWLRLFWILVVVACFLGFLVQLQTLITKYLAYNVNTETKLEFSERPFPVITVCHLNPWKKSAAAQSDYIQDMMTSYESPGPDASYGFGAERNGARQQRAVRLVTLANELLYGLSTESHTTNSTLTDPAYSYEDLIIACTYNAQTCNASDFDTYDDKNFGRCIVFNGLEGFTSSRAGPLYGLRLTIRTDQEEYLPWTDSSGVVAAIHNKSDPPFPDVLGYYAPPGTSSSLGVRYVTTTRQPAPYGDCTKQKDVKLSNYEGYYQPEACYRSCIQDEIIKQCACYHPGFDYLGGSAHSSCFGDTNDTSAYVDISDKLNCIDGVMANNASGGFNSLSSCDCKQPCEVQTFSVTVSTAQWPSTAYTPTECTAAVQTGQPWMDEALPGTKMNMSLCIAWYKKQTLLLEIYYERMNYQVLTESPAYTFVSLISEIGGQVGLFLGMSIISIFEFITLLLLLCYYMTSHSSRRVELEALEKDLNRMQREGDEQQREEELRDAKRRAAELRKQANMYDDRTPDSLVAPKVVDSGNF